MKKSIPEGSGMLFVYYKLLGIKQEFLLLECKAS
jgi:hypothetical protein